MTNSNPESSPPSCERCGGAVIVARRLPKVGPHPELHTFRCENCEHVFTREAGEHR